MSIRMKAGRCILYIIIPLILISILIQNFKQKYVIEGPLSEKFEQEQNYNLATLPQEPDPNIQRHLPSSKTHSLKDRQKLKVVIGSTWRSGSTFLGEIVSSVPGAFYHYEPLLLYGLKQIGQSDPEFLDAHNLLKDLLSCNYSNKETYIKYGQDNTDMFSRNPPLRAICSNTSRNKCYTADNIGAICNAFNLQVMKVVRARLSILGPLLESENTKIIWLVRDPRASMSSRNSKVKWCKTPYCNDPKYLCSYMLEDLKTFSDLKKLYPKNITFLRYEDLANNTTNIVKRLFDFLGLKVTDETRKYLEGHISGDIPSPWSTVRKSKAQFKKWLIDTPWSLIANTQFHCRKAMNKMGYRLFESESEKHLYNFVEKLDVDLS